MDTVLKRNISGEDLEVAILNYQIVKAGEVVEMPVNYPWHTDENPAPCGFSDSIWETVQNGDPNAEVINNEVPQEQE